MTGGLHSGHRRDRIALAFVVLALLMRLLVPAGWMPAGERGLAITLCTGAGATEAWIDEQGNVHQGKAEAQQSDHSCLFSGFAALLDLPATGAADAEILPAIGLLPVLPALAVAIGRGLAAPPPPSTGPPARP